MTPSLQNGITTLESLFTAVPSFRIPQYQRAYSWTSSPHLDAFLEDLRLQMVTLSKNKEKRYFLGTFLLHERDAGDSLTEVDVVDGQQRLTTSIIFIATALDQHQSGKISLGAENPPLLRRNFVMDELTGLEKFRTIQEDEAFFRTSVLKTAAGTQRESTPSSRLLQEAARFFAENVRPDEWPDLVRVLRTAKVMIYAVNSAEDATQIFELQNDRGKPLTNLEALKSYLMHSVYLYHEARADVRLASIQSQFAEIYRLVEALAELERCPDENQILMHHCTAFLKWSGGEYYNPKQMVKDLIKGMKGEEVVPWIETFVASLVESFRAVKTLFERRDYLHEFAELLVLNRMASFWPLILRAWKHDTTPQKADFSKLCRLLEVFVFRGYAVAGLRSDTGLSFFHGAARDFSGDFWTLFQRIGEQCFAHNLEQRFAAGLDNAQFYWEEGKDALYMLWRYENHLRAQTGRQAPQLSWRDFVEPRNYGAKFSVEHVAAQDHALSSSIVEWTEGEAKPFHEVALNRLGNLVIDSVSTNSSKGKKDFSDKLHSLSVGSTYLSQGELISFLEDSEDLVWNLEAVRRRHKHLVEFAMRTWHPSSWL